VSFNVAQVLGFARKVCMPQRRTRKIVVRKLRGWSGGLLGHCYPSGLIEIDPRQDEQEFLNTLVHELLHREQPDLSETAVIRIADWISWELWKFEYRRLRDDNLKFSRNRKKPK
jgi:hypothetical protein